MPQLDILWQQIKFPMPEKGYILLIKGVLLTPMQYKL